MHSIIFRVTAYRIKIINVCQLANGEENGIIKILD